MQRWIVLGVIALVLSGIVGGFGLYQYRKGKPDKVWVPLPLNPTSEEAARLKLRDQLHTELRKPSVMKSVSTDLGLVTKFKLPDETAAAAELEKRLFVEVGQMDTPMGKSPSLNIGVSGKAGEHELLGTIAERLAQEVHRIIGGARSQRPAPAPSF